MRRINQASFDRRALSHQVTIYGLGFESESDYGTCKVLFVMFHLSMSFPTLHSLFRWLFGFHEKRDCTLIDGLNSKVN